MPNYIGTYVSRENPQRIFPRDLKRDFEELGFSYGLIPGSFLGEAGPCFFAGHGIGGYVRCNREWEHSGISMEILPASEETSEQENAVTQLLLKLDSFKKV